MLTEQCVRRALERGELTWFREELDWRENVEDRAVLTGKRADAVWVLLRLRMYTTDGAAKLAKSLPMRYAKQVAALKPNVMEAVHLDDIKLDVCDILQAAADERRQDMATAET